MNELEVEMLTKFERRVMENGVSNTFLVELIKSAGSFLNLETIPNYAKRTGKSYQGVKKFRHIEKIFDVKFVIDNC